MTTGDLGDGDWAGRPRPFLDRQPGAHDVDRGFGDLDDPGDDPDVVRPYLVTGGRTTIRPDVNVETMVLATGASTTDSLEDEHVRLLHLAAEPMAVAELAAHLGIPLGVAMIITSDLAEIGMVRLTDASDGGSGEPADDTALIRKVVNGVLKLRNAETI
jgi:hypothetical protein